VHGEVRGQWPPGPAAAFVSAESARDFDDLVLENREYFEHTQTANISIAFWNPYFIFAGGGLRQRRVCARLRLGRQRRAASSGTDAGRRDLVKSVPVVSSGIIRVF
jgi:hypothetical protein